MARSANINRVEFSETGNGARKYQTVELEFGYYFMKFRSYRLEVESSWRGRFGEVEHGHWLYLWSNILIPPSDIEGKNVRPASLRLSCVAFDSAEHLSASSLCNEIMSKKFSEGTPESIRACSLLA